MAFLFSNQSFPMPKHAWILRGFLPIVICSYHERKIKTLCKGLYSVDSLWQLLIRKRTEDGVSPFLIFQKATKKTKRRYVQQVLLFGFPLFVLTDEKQKSDITYLLFLCVDQNEKGNLVALFLISIMEWEHEKPKDGLFTDPLTTQLFLWLTYEIIVGNLVKKIWWLR